VNIIRGKVWKFGDDINTDVISPTRYMAGPLEELKKHALEAINPRFPQEVKAGDIIVGGNNFGCGSSREDAPTVLKALGVAAIAAESFARIFFRNAVAIGLPIVVCPGVSSSFEEGDELELDLVNSKVQNITKKKTLDAQPLPSEMQEVLSKGGILPLLKGMAKR